MRPIAGGIYQVPRRKAPDLVEGPGVIAASYFFGALRAMMSL
jgi:hypothetical protein